MCCALSHYNNSTQSGWRNTDCCILTHKHIQVKGHCSDNSQSQSCHCQSILRSIFISGIIDFFLIKTLNCKKFKQKEHWVQKLAGVSGGGLGFRVRVTHADIVYPTTAQHSTDTDGIPYNGWHFSEPCVIDFSITTGMTNPIIRWKHHIYRQHTASHNGTICFHTLILFWCDLFFSHLN